MDGVRLHGSNMSALVSEAAACVAQGDYGFSCCCTLDPSPDACRLLINLGGAAQRDLDEKSERAQHLLSKIKTLHQSLTEMKQQTPKLRQEKTEGW